MGRSIEDEAYERQTRMLDAAEDSVARTRDLVEVARDIAHSLKRRRPSRERRINAKAWQLFCAHIDRGLFDRLSSEKDDAARKAIATAACNALEAAEIFVKTVEE